MSVHLTLLCSFALLSIDINVTARSIQKWSSSVLAFPAKKKKKIQIECLSPATTNPRFKDRPSLLSSSCLPSLPMSASSREASSSFSPTRWRSHFFPKTVFTASLIPPNSQSSPCLPHSVYTFVWPSVECLFVIVGFCSSSSSSWSSS